MPRHAITGSVHTLGSNGYAVMLTPTGAGGSRWNDLAVTRWLPNSASGPQGGFVYLRDVADGAVWSAAAAPCGGAARVCADGATWRSARRDGTLATTLEIAVDPDAPIEVRGIGVRNEGRVARVIDVTSYAELVLGSARTDASHPAYSKMFVQTAVEGGALLAWRRKKDPVEPGVWAAHALIVDGPEDAPREWETDRMRFVGRDGSLAAPEAQRGTAHLSGTVGTVLDPIFSLRGRITVAPRASRRVAFVTAVGATREEALANIASCATPSACADIFARARAHAARELHATGADASAGARFQALSGALAGTDLSWRVRDPAGEGGAPVLWAKGISGDLPIVLAKIGSEAQLGLVRDLLRAQRWWRSRLLPADVVIVTAPSDALDAAVRGLADAAGHFEKLQGNVFVLRADQLDARLRGGLETAACATLDGSDGGLARQVARRAGPVARAFDAEWPRPARACGGGEQPASTPDPAGLDFWNGTGGFARDSGEYVTVLRDGAHTPTPWSHIVANPGFGFLVTATGGGYCWAQNSQQNPITAWSNDAVVDPVGEAFLLRDTADGREWSATASPARAAGATCTARFGMGYARFDACADGIESELTQCVAPADPVKLSRLRVRNRSGRIRRIRVAQVVAWSLGAIGSDPQPTTRVETDPGRCAALACNPWRDEFAAATAFIATGADRAAAGNDGRARSAVVVDLEIPAGGEACATFLLGEGVDRAAALGLIDRYRRVDVSDVLSDTRKVWDSVLQPLQVTTPQRSLDLLVNRWLPYQVLACRVWARTAFYQASGAFGFRDQLQDVAALSLARPDLARAHILLAASRQFEEGDVQHWWLPPSGKGVRTRIVDDRLWLPYVVAHYVDVTGDAAILDARVPFVHGAPLQTGQTDSFFAPDRSAADATLYEHCARAIEVSLAVGVHGLPLMGTGDWNDGMNRVGAGGKGESVWMGWFLIKVIGDFAPLARQRGDARAAGWRDHARAFELAIETKAWDGAWYRRAFYDDASPLGSAADPECRVESMAQSWSVLSGRGDPARTAPAMRAVREHLVHPDGGYVALFTPPFDHTPHDPGYIKGYPPGLRENGGQYTHGSIWSLIAFAELGDGGAVGELLEIFDPIRKSDTREKLDRYKVEPYVQCADVYSVAPHVGRGGWTWYTGSAGWFYRAIVEWVLGLRVHDGRLEFAPCLPPAWGGFEATFRRGSTAWHVAVADPEHAGRGHARIELDGVTLQGSDASIPLIEDGANHRVRVTLSKEPS